MNTQNDRSMFAFAQSVEQRLKTPAEFKQVYNSKQWGGSALFTYNVKARSDESVRLGVTVSKKVSKLAVDRNRIKRQVREFFRHHQYQLSGADVVITAKPACSKASDAERAESLTELWSKLKRWQRWHQRQTSS